MTSKPSRPLGDPSHPPGLFAPPFQIQGASPRFEMRSAHPAPGRVALAKRNNQRGNASTNKSAGRQPCADGPALQVSSQMRYGVAVGKHGTTRIGILEPSTAQPCGRRTNDPPLRPPVVTETPSCRSKAPSTRKRKTNTAATAFAEARSLSESTVRRGSDFSPTSRGLLLPRASRQVLAHSQIVLNLSLYLPT